MQQLTLTTKFSFPPQNLLAVARLDSAPQVATLCACVQKVFFGYIYFWGEDKEFREIYAGIELTAEGNRDVVGRAGCTEAGIVLCVA